jgi:hypothetical protein
MIRPAVNIGKKGPMTMDLEKRTSRRYAIHGVITLHTSLMTPNVINAHLLNCSEEGIGFSADKELVAGTTIVFKASNNAHPVTDDRADCPLRPTSRVTVRWCREGSNGDRPVYIYGATYAPP